MGLLAFNLFERDAKPFAISPHYPAMAGGLALAVDAQTKHPRQSDRGSDMKAGAGRRKFSIEQGIS
jgi:hypothetical protein